MATDGDRTIVVFNVGPDSGEAAIYAQFLERDGTPAFRHPRLLVEPAFDLRLIDVVWSGGTYVVFYVGYRNGETSELRALIVNRKGDVLGPPRVVPLRFVPDHVIARGDEIVLSSSWWLVRMRSDITITDQISLRPLRLTSGPALAFGPDAVAVFSAEREGITLRKLRGSRLSAPVAVTARTVAGTYGNGAEVVWTGSEYVGAWTDCGYPHSCLVWMTRFDANGRELDEPRWIGTVDEVYRANGAGLTLHVVGENTVFVLMEGGFSPNRRVVGRRFRAGVEVQPEMTRIDAPPVATVVGPQGLLFAVDARLRLGILRTYDPFPARLDVRPFIVTAADEELWSAAGTATHAAVLRRRATGELVSKFVVTVMTHDGTAVYEHEVDGWLASLATDGRDFYLLWAHPNEYYEPDDGVWLQKIAPGTTPVRAVDPAHIFTAGLVRHNDTLLVTWHDYEHGYLRVFDGTGFSPPAVISDQPCGDWRPHFVAAGDELLLLTYDGFPNRWRATPIAPTGQALGKPLPLYDGRPRCAWNGLAVGCLFEPEDDDGWTFALRDAAGTFRETATVLGQEGFWRDVPSVRAMGDRYLILRMTAEGEHLVVVHPDGQLADKIKLRDAEGPYETGILVPLNGREVLVFYNRNLYTRPHVAVRRVFARPIAID